MRQLFDHSFQTIVGHLKHTDPFKIKKGVSIVKLPKSVLQ